MPMPFTSQFPSFKQTVITAQQILFICYCSQTLSWMRRISNTRPAWTIIITLVWEKARHCDLEVFNLPDIFYFEESYTSRFLCGKLLMSAVTTSLGYTSAELSMLLEILDRRDEAENNLHLVAIARLTRTLRHFFPVLLASIV